MVPVQSGGGYYYPVAGGMPACFSGDTIVKTKRGDVAMKELKVGEHVLTKFGNTVSGFITSRNFADTFASLNSLEAIIDTSIWMQWILTLADLTDHTISMIAVNK